MYKVLFGFLVIVFVIIYLNLFVSAYLCFERIYCINNDDTKTFKKYTDGLLCKHLRDTVIYFVSDFLIFLWIRYLFFHFNIMSEWHKFFE